MDIEPKEVHHYDIAGPDLSKQKILSDNVQ